MQRFEGSILFQQVGLFALITVLLFALDGAQVLQPIKLPVEKGFASLSQVSGQFGQVIMMPWKMLIGYHQDQSRIEQLETMLAQTNVDKSRLIQLEIENNDLRQLIDSPRPENWSYVLAPVLGSENGHLLLGVGQSSGISQGDTVTYQEHLVGSIVSVSANLSRLRLITHPDKRVAVRIRGSGVDGLIQGKGTQVMLVQILQSTTLQSGQLIVSSGIDGHQPGLVIGTIKQIQSDSHGIYKEAMVDLPIDLTNLHTVFVIRGEN